MRSGNHPSSSASDSTTLIISNGEMEDITKIVKSLEDSGLLLKGISEANQNEAKEQKGGLFCMLLGILGTSLLGNAVAVKEMNKAGEIFVRAGYGSSIKKKKIFNAALSFN